jgi:hypothetical protein
MSNENRSGGGGWLLILAAVVLALFVAQYIGTKPSVPPEANQAITRWVAQGRRQAAMGSQETKEGYVIDPSLAGRMLADTAIAVRTTGVRGFSDHLILRARVTAPTAAGAEETVTRYFAIDRGPGTDWTVTGDASARDWHLKLW